RCFFRCRASVRDLHSFPTRRSSDLADGGGKGANYKSASQWFRKAAERGVADSQYNLGILYARGIGVEQNLAESYKWFSLAAAQRSEEHTSELQSRSDLVCRLLLEKK